MQNATQKAKKKATCESLHLMGLISGFYRCLIPIHLPKARLKLIVTVI